MHNVQFLAKQYKLSAKQVRYRLRLLDPVLEEHVHIGRHNAKLLTDPGLAIFERYVELELEGVKGKQALDLLTSEVADIQEGARQETDNDSSNDERLLAELRERVLRQTKIIDALREEIAALNLENSRLRDGIPKGLPQNSQGRLTRWQHFKAALFGVEQPANREK